MQQPVEIRILFFLLVIINVTGFSDAQPVVKFSVLTAETLLIREDV